MPVDINPRSKKSHMLLAKVFKWHLNVSIERMEVEK